MLEFRLFRHLNFLAANISQFLAGDIELGLGFLIPYYLLLVVGVARPRRASRCFPARSRSSSPGPLAGRAFDRSAGRMPLVFGYLVLAGSGAALALAAAMNRLGADSGTRFQGLGLGMVLTVNDPTGLGAVPRRRAARRRA